MCRVIDVKELAHSLPLAALSVIATEDRYAQRRAKLQRAVKRIEKHHIDRSVHGSPNHQPQHLLFEIATICADKQNCNCRDTAPIRTERDRAYQEYDHRFLPCFKLFAIIDNQQHQTPRQRPDHARLIENRLPEWDQRVPEQQTVGKVRDKSEQEQSSGVFFDVSGIVIALRDKVPHDRRGDPAENVQRDRVPRRIVTGEQNPCQVIHRHGDDGDQLDLIAAELKLRFHR